MQMRAGAWESLDILSIARPLCGGTERTNLPPYPRVCSRRICIRIDNTDILIQHHPTTEDVFLEKMICTEECGMERQRW